MASFWGMMVLSGLGIALVCRVLARLLQTRVMSYQPLLTMRQARLAPRLFLAEERAWEHGAFKQFTSATS